MAEIEAVPDWMPHKGVESLPCGRWFDGVGLPTFVGLRVVSRLRERSGPVVQDQVADVLTWLVLPGAAEEWEERAPGVDIVRGPRVVAVPPAAWCEGPWTGGSAIRWLIRPTPTCLTDPPVLLDALRHVLPPRGDHRA
ncbi:hypothetical protein [Streptomyces sp. MP131-18]|uniref:hypothetical protein n=1 Tax=Streptomyces sp. MP131-18 TaxID=1857892 RepID=UPI0009D1EE0F|nr:hypothetical protein [Streptomyces sp. MP131-18]ONK11020.1 hypothetical protein STBA_17480 [Streptomyces sp. MP131-18]